MSQPKSTAGLELEGSRDVRESSRASPRTAQEMVDIQSRDAVAFTNPTGVIKRHGKGCK